MFDKGRKEKADRPWQPDLLPLAIWVRVRLTRPNPLLFMWGKCVSWLAYPTAASIRLGCTVAYTATSVADVDSLLWWPDRLSIQTRAASSSRLAVIFQAV